MIVNGYGYQRSLAAHREQIEAAIARHRDKLARERIEAVIAAGHYEAAKSHDAAVAQREAEQREAIAAMHAKNVAAEARMRAAQDPSIISWQGAAAALFLLALIGGIFLVANYLGAS